MPHSIDAPDGSDKPGGAICAAPKRPTRRVAFAVLAAGLAAALAGCRTVVRPPSSLNFDFDEKEDRVGGGGV